MIRIAAIAALMLLAAAGCGGKQLDTFATLQVSDSDVPNYEVIRDDGSVELLADTDTEGAKQVIADWLAQNLDRDYVKVQVVRSPNSRSVLCRAEYIRAEDTPIVATSPRLQADEYPAMLLGPCDP